MTSAVAEDVTNSSAPADACAVLKHSVSDHTKPASCDVGSTQSTVLGTSGVSQCEEHDSSPGVDPGTAPASVGGVHEVTAALEAVHLPVADESSLSDTELAGDVAELLSIPVSDEAAAPDRDARLESWGTPPSVHGMETEVTAGARPAEIASLCSTDASEMAGSPFTALSMPDTARERLYPDLTNPSSLTAAASAEQNQQEREDECSPASEEIFEPSAPVAESPMAVPLAMSASQVSISEGPFSFETEKKDPLVFLGRDVAPMTDLQLSDFYHNEELRRRHEYVDHFVAEYGPAARPDDEFAALVEGYRRAGVALRAAARQQAELHTQYEARRSKCWELVRRTVRAEAECDDGRSLSATHEFQSAAFDPAALQGLRAALSALRRLLYEEYALHAYSVLLARLQVETYLHQVAGRYPDVAAPPPAAPRLQYQTSGHEEAAAALRACCAVLFAQQRRRGDAEFGQQTRRWLLQVAAPLLRLGTVNDHLFLLHQTLRCPSGSATWTAELLQPPRPDLPPGLDHVLTALAVLLSPVR